MDVWEDQGIVLAARMHGENGAIVSLLTEHHGRQAGYVRGARSTKMRGTLEIGNIVDVHWQARNSENLGSFKLELIRSPAAIVLDDPMKLTALQSVCALCDSTLPEREGHPGLFHGVLTVLDMLTQDIWAESYIMWEIALLKELGFSLGLDACAGGGDPQTLTYVSPKTGRAVSAEKGAPYKDKLLILPHFLGGHAAPENNIVLGLKLTGYFLEHWVYAHHSKGVPEARMRLALKMSP